MGKGVSSHGFGFKRMVILLIMIFTDCSYGGVKDNKASRQYLDVERKSIELKKHAVKSIQSEDGDIIDCIDIYKQPAFDHPSLRNHTIQMTPNYKPMTETTTETTKAKTWAHRKEGSSMTVTSQLWQRSGSCPEGTIPVRRVQGHNSLKSKSLEHYGRKNASIFQQVTQLNDSKKIHLHQTNHSVAILLAEGYHYSGAKGDIKVYNPNVESDDEYSTSRVSLKNGPHYDYENVESGWAVNPSVYGDRQTRLFVYWTVDSSKTTGCFDLTCSGFVQTSSEIALGASIYPIPGTGGLPYQIIIYIYKDPNTGNWWVQYGEEFNIGYWPQQLFSLLSYHAASVEWGGEVYSSKVGTTPHTTTGMGSGRFPDWVTQDSGFIKRIRIRDNNPVLKIPVGVSTYTNEFNCYNVYYVDDYIADPEFFFGGPGHNDMCP